MYKNNIRIKMLHKRYEYTSNNIQKKSLLINEILFKNFDFNKINIIHTFLPILQKNEINTKIIISTILQNYKHCKILIPKINFKNKTLDHYYYKDNKHLLQNKYGIDEPYNCEKYKKKHNINIILVPLLAFDKNGHRVGYGGGYYDKFMIHYPKSIKIGLSLEEPIQILDINNHDIKLNFCITPKKLYKFD